MIPKLALLALFLLAGMPFAHAVCVGGNPAFSSCVRTYGLPEVKAPPIAPNKLRSNDTRLRVGRPEIHDRLQNPNRDFMQRRRVNEENIFFSGSDKDGNLVMGTCVGGRCR